MKLYYSLTSPYSRKVRLVLLEKNIQEPIEMVIVDPFIGDAELQQANPLGKVPTLVLNQQNSLFDSSVICQYLDRFKGDTKLIPAPLKWNILRWQALCDGLLDAAYLSVVESRRPTQEQSLHMQSVWASDIIRCLSTMNAELKHLGDDIHFAHLCFATAVGYIELRLPHLMPTDSALAHWYDDFKQRPSMQGTQPF